MHFLYTSWRYIKKTRFFLYMHTVMQKKHVFLSTYLCIFAPCSLSREHLVLLRLVKTLRKSGNFFQAKQRLSGLVVLYPYYTQ